MKSTRMKSTRMKSKRNSRRVRRTKTRTAVCWKWYHRVPGTKPYAKHSCAKN